MFKFKHVNFEPKTRQNKTNLSLSVYPYIEHKE